MLEGINSSKKCYFIWLCVCLILFFGLFAVMQYGISEDPDYFKTNAERLLFGLAMPYIIAVFPLGWTVRRRIMKWYAHVPTEKIKVFDTNLAITLWRFIVCDILAIFDLALLTLYMAASVIIGIVFVPYFIISGIVFLATKKI